MNEAKKEYMEWLKSATKEMIDGITTDSEFDLKLLQMSYGFVRRCFLESKKKRRCSVTDTEFWKQSIIEVINKIDSMTSLMKIYYFVKAFLS